MSADTVLVVDDEPLMRQLMTLLLTSMGLETSEAESGAAALQVLERTRPGLVLLDISMPNMSGLAVLGAIRDRWGRSLPVVMTTASGASADVQQALALGADGYLLKPVQASALRSRVARHVSVAGETWAPAESLLTEDDRRRFRSR